MLDALRADVLGVTVGVVARLLAVGLCHYLGVARLSLMLALLIPYRYDELNGRDPAVLRCLMNGWDDCLSELSSFLKLPSLLELPKPVSMCRRGVLMLSYRRQEP